MKAIMVSLLVLATMAPAAFAQSTGYLTPFQLTELRMAIRGFDPTGLSEAQLQALLSTLSSGDTASKNNLPTALYNTYRNQK